MKMTVNRIRVVVLGSPRSGKSEQTVLNCKTYAPDEKVASFLSLLPEPPADKSIKLAVNDLIDLGALTKSEKLSRLGTLLSHMTLHPRLGCSLVHAALLGTLLAASMLSHCADDVEIFSNAPDRREEIREIKSKYHPRSDHCALHRIQEEYEKIVQEQGSGAVNTWCDAHGLRKDRLNYVKAISNLHLQQLLQSTVIEVDPDVTELTRFSDIEELTAGALLSGVNTLLVTRRRVKMKGKLTTALGIFTSSGDRAHIGSESVNYGIKKRKSTTQLLVYFGGHHSTERRALVVYKTTVVSPHAVLMFCNGDIERSEENEDTTVLSLPRHRLRIHVPANQAESIIKVREMLWKTFKYYIERDLKTIPYEELTNISRFKTRLVKTVARILVEADNEKTKNINDEDCK